MGSRMKKTVFDEQTSKALKKWRMAVKRKNKGGKSPTRTLGESVSSSPSSLFPTGGHTLHRFMTTGHSSHNYTYEEAEVSDTDAGEPLSPSSSPGNYVINIDGNNDRATEINVPQHEGETSSNGDDFSFVKPAPPKHP